MARDTIDAVEIESREQLVKWFEVGSKPKQQWRLGTEHEKFGFYRKTFAPVPYEGIDGIGAIVEGLGDKLNWEPILDKGRAIGLTDPSGGGAVSLEPGGQFELSGAPLMTLHETMDETRAHLSDVGEIADPLGIGFLGIGGSPIWSRAETPIMPKSRYNIMANYMPKVGTRGLDMMFRTSTVQVNLDFADEADMAVKMRVSLALQPLATALFAASPFMDGKPTGFLSTRGEIWRDTDRDRTGPLPEAFATDFGFAAYTDWALDVPMYFVKRGDTYHDVTGVSFRAFMDGALKDRLPGVRPEIGDWANHLGSLFPDVRLKRYIEQRGADVGPLSHIVALPAFWVGLLYDSSSLRAAADLIADWSIEERAHLRDTAPRLGLKTPFRNGMLHDLARDILPLAKAGLAARGHVRDGVDESIYLEPIEAIIEDGLTLADRMLQSYAGAWGGDLTKAFIDYAY
jgi:glutamate--cysteine ligase